MLDDLASYVNTTSVLTFGVAFALAAYILQPGQRKYKLPPYPWTRIPIIGNVVSLLWSKDKAFILFYKTAKQPEYSKVFMIKVGARNICILNDIEIVKEAVQKKATDFAGRPSVFSTDTIVQNKDIVFRNYGDEWKFHRKVAHQAIRNFASGEILDKIVHNAVTVAASAMAKEGDKPFVIKSYIELLTFNMLAGICFGTTYEYDDPEFQKFTNITKEGLDAFGSGLPADVFPWLSFLPFQGRKLLKFMKIFTGLLESELTKHKENFDPDNLGDLTDYLLMAQKEVEAEDSSNKGILTDTHLVMTVFDIFGAGIDTINASIQSIVAEAICNPEEQERIYQEINGVLGDRFPTGKDRASLPLTEAFLYEVLRKDTFAVLGVPLATTCDTTIGNYELPKDTMVMINFWALHNDPDHWDSPDTFRPDRFLDDGGQLGPRPQSFMPFSAGRRVCLGENLAKAELMIIIPALIQKYRFLPAPDFKYTVEDTGLANIPKPYSVILEPRK